MRKRIATWLRAAAFVVPVALVWPAVQADGVVGSCSAPGAAGGLLGSLGIAPALSSGLLGKGAAAGSADPCMPGEPASIAGNGPSTLAGNPVDVIRGVKMDRAVDLHFPAPVPAPARASGGLPASGLELLFARVYASNGPGSDALGPGWRHSFSTRLHATRDVGGRTQLQILQADGRVLRFGRGVSHVGGVLRHAALAREDGVLERLPPAGDRQWVWHWRSGRELRFREDGRLVEISEPGRARIRLAYDVHDRLVSVSESGGRALRLSYDPQEHRDDAKARGARLVGVDGPRGSRVAYAYDARGRLAHVRHADGASVRYRYADGPGARLASVALPDGSMSEYRYDAEGRVEYSRAAGESDDAALRFEHSAGASADAGETAVVQHGRERARYRWRLIDGERRLVEAVGEGCARCPGVGVRYAYDAAGIAAVATESVRLNIERDRLGRPVVIRRQAIGGIAARTAAGVSSVAGHAGRMTGTQALRIAWAADPTRDRLARVVRPSNVPGREHVIRFVYDDTRGSVRLLERGFAPSVEHVPGGARARSGVPIQRTLGDLLSGDSLRANALDSAGPRKLPPDAVEVQSGLMQSTSATGVTTRYWLDDFSRVVAVHSPDSGLSRWHFDGFGRMVREEAADGSVARYRHDAQGRLVARIVTAPGVRPVTTRFRYVAAGLAAVDHPEQSERYERDAGGRLVKRTVRLRIGADRIATLETRYRHDASTGALIGKTLPDGSWLLLERDSAGQVVALRRMQAGRASSTAADARLAGSANGDAEARPEAAEEAQLLVGALARDRSGITHATFGNRARLTIRRDPAGRPARVCHASAAGHGDVCDLLDHGLVFDTRGALLRWHRDGATASQLFDRRGALVQSWWRGAGRQLSWRYGYDANGNRLLEQARVADAGRNQGNDGHQGSDPHQGSDAGPARLAHAHSFAPAATTVAALVAGTNRLTSKRRVSQHPDRVADEVRFEWDPAGRLLRDGARRYRWTAGGLLAAISTPAGVLAEYRYNHRGERVAKRTVAGAMHFLYDEARRPLAELDADGRIVRQFVHLADLPVAVIDALPSGERIAYLHLNHLGAPEVATGGDGGVLWRATFEPFGRRIERARDAEDTSVAAESDFTLPLRLPGQYEDTESGLHYNDHRFYDPDSGRYLSPDPLGLRAGANPYVYAANDPLAWTDPTGLLLFAFDGTGNSDPPPRSDDWSNVHKLARTYADGRVWYMSGVGTPDRQSGITGGLGDTVTAQTARARVDYMLAQLEHAVRTQPTDGRRLEVDVIGFSRGAAMGRDFANRVAERIEDGVYRQLGACVRLRFLGLWDTVAQFGVDGMGNFAWKLAVPATAAYTAHAVALNEHRMLFPGESIVGSPLGGVRVERGFIGAHADVGGSYAEGDLSDVALTWMHRQAQLAGVRVFALSSEFARVSSPLLHDSRGSVMGDREFRYRNTFGLTMRNPAQKIAPVEGLQWRDTARFIERYAAPLADAYGEPTIVGQVDVAAYSAWLDAHYAIAIGAGP